MAKDPNRIPEFNDIVFEIRNKEYGAYVLRKKYSFNLFISLLIGTIIMATAVFIPYINARALITMQKHTLRQVEIKMENFDQPKEIVIPPAPPPPPPADVIKQAKYIPPVIVDSVKAEDTIELMTADDARNKIMNEEIVEKVQEVKEELVNEKSEPEPFISVEEKPEPPGGLEGLQRYIAENTKYPEIAKENNIQGKVIVRFCVNSKGNIEQISIFKGVDPALDAEAIRVVKTFPKFKPGRQSGVPVPVWFIVPFDFHLQ